MGNRHFDDILYVGSTEKIFEEAKTVLCLISPDFNIQPVSAAFETAVSLFEGKYPGYQPCNTKYHDLNHTVGVFLAMARLIHGAAINGKNFSKQYIALGLIAALFHDGGYIQEEADTKGTGAKYTKIHVRRSMELLARHGTAHGLSDEETAAGGLMILCTDPSADIAVIDFPSEEIAFLGKTLGVADFLAQMADRIYLEKLLYLYHEFKEGGVEGYEDEIDLLKKTTGFYMFTEQRIRMMLEKADRFLRSHFALRWNISENLYKTAIERQKAYLQQILTSPDFDPVKYLKRGGVAEEIFLRNRERKADMKTGKIITQDSEIRTMLLNSKEIAVLGLSPKPERDSFRVAKYLKEQGYKIIPVRPGQKEILGEKVCASLDDIHKAIDIVVVFRNNEQVMSHVEETIRLMPKVFWMQLGIENHEAAKLLTDAGIDVVMNRCIMVEHERLCK